jgi:hypothetical protein
MLEAGPTSNVVSNLKMSVTATQTVLAELDPSYQPSDNPPKSTFHAHEAINLGRLASRGEQQPDDDLRGDLPPPNTAVDALERWNSPKSNMYALFGTYLSFLILGMNDASPGPLIPYVSLPLSHSLRRS